MEDDEQLEAVDEVGDTPLTYACMGNSFDGVKYLVEKGALINTEHNNRSPIQIACGKSDMNIIEYLLDHGADLSVGSNSEIGTPLHWAAGENRVEVAQLLLERGANVDALNAPGLTPLILATANTCAPMVQLLLSHNADPKVVLRERPYQQIALADNITPLHIAAEAGHMDTLKAFLALPVIAELANLTTEKTHLKPIHFAVEAGHKEVTAQLVDLTEEYKGQDSASVFESVKKQFDAAKTETTPAVKPEVKLTTGQRKICEKKRELGKAAFNKKHYEEAVQYFTEALEINPYEERYEQRESLKCSLLSNRSAAYIELGKYKEALEDGQKAVELSPKWAKAHYRVGMAYFKMGLYTDAATAFYAGCELAPTNKELSNMFKQALETGKRAYQQENREAAERVVEKKE